MKKTIISIIACIVLLTGIYYVATNGIPPEAHVVNGIMNVNESRAVDAQMALSFEVDEAMLKEAYDPSTGMNDQQFMKVFELLERSGIRYNLRYDLSSPQQVFNCQGQMELLFDDQSLFTFRGTASLDEIRLAIPTFYEKGLKLPLEELITSNGGEDMSFIWQIDWIAYREILMDHSDIDTASYMEMMENFLVKYIKKEKGTTLDIQDESIKLSQYSIDFTIGDALNFLDDYMASAYADPEQQALMTDKITQVMEHFIDSGDYQYFDLNEEDVRAFMTQFQILLPIASRTSTNQMRYYVDEMDEEMLSYTIHLDVAIDDKEVLRKISSAFQVDYLTINCDLMINNIGNQVKIDTLDTVNVMEMIEDPAVLGKYIKSFSKGMTEAILQGDVYQNLFDELAIFETSLEIQKMKDELRRFNDQIQELEDDQLIKYFETGLKDGY